MKFLERARNFELAEKDIKTIHGETDIVLKNVKTGLVERFHDENTFQSEVLQLACKSFGEADCRWSFNYETLVGGLLLFRDAITVGKKFMPGGNEMIGRGYRGSVTMGDNPYQGTFNSAESSASSSAIQQVYDFATNQANGTIGCVSLTSNVGGAVGYGENAYYIQSGQRYNLNYGQTGALSYEKNVGYYGGFRYAFVSCEENILTISKTPVSIVTGSVFNGLSKNLTFDLTQIGNAGDIVPNGVWGDAGNGRFRFTGQTGSVAAGANFYYYEFNATDESLTECYFVNSSGTTLTVDSMSTLFFCHDYIVHHNGSNTVYIFDAANSTLLDVQTLPTWTGQWSSGSADMLPGEISDDLLLFQSSDGVKIYDAISKTLKCMPLDNNSSSAQRIGVATRLASVEDGLLRARMWYREYGFKNPLYLATINNLGSPVTKTAAQTMKVTYTLTEV